MQAGLGGARNREQTPPIIMRPIREAACLRAPRVRTPLRCMKAEEHIHHESA